MGRYAMCYSGATDGRYLYTQNQRLPSMETLFQSDSGSEFNIGKNH